MQIRIAFVGDIMPGGVFVWTGGINQEVISTLSSFDIRIGTLETAFGDGRILCHKKNNDQLGTIIYSPDKSVEMLVNMNITAVSLANNHSCDCDLEGLYHTMRLLDKNGIKHFGAGHNAEEAAKPAMIEINGLKICLLGYLQEYHYLYKGLGYRPTEQVGGVNIYNIEKVISDVLYYKKKCDYVFVMPHWGKEGSVFPRLQEVQDARRIIDAGADGVIGSHAHVVQPIIRYKRGLIAMNLGNFAFPDRYVTKPRISCYPTKEERSKIVPVVSSFCVVDSLSYKKVAGKERLGAIMEVLLDGHTISYREYQTELSEANFVVLRRDCPFRERIRNYYVHCLIKEKRDILYKSHLKVRNLLKHIRKLLLKNGII